VVGLVTGRIAIIPARGGSKRIPGKNIIDFEGKPMIGWTIEAAINSKCFDRILVSTEDEEIAQIAREFGAEVPFLRESHTDDVSAVSEATLAALNQATAFWQEEYQTVVQLMANCPLRTAEDIRVALEAFDASPRRFQISCFRYGWMNPWWAVELDDAGTPSRLFEDALSQRSQDLPTLFCPTGAIWIANVADFLSEGTFYGAGHCFEQMRWESAVDIDDYEDLNFAEAIWLKRARTRINSND
jgi:N-acylneuraminate cytidylyltransferase